MGVQQLFLYEQHERWGKRLIKNKSLTGKISPIIGFRINAALRVTHSVASSRF
jgi:hypothetical protein